jgi:dihydroflavonol-4-reductase
MAERVLVTGGTGFIGSAVVRKLLARDATVRVLARPTSKLLNLENLPVEIFRGDLLDPKSVAKAARGCQKIFHVGGDYRLWSPNPREMYATNVDGTRNVLAAARAVGVGKIIHTSSVGTIVPRTNGVLANEINAPPATPGYGHYHYSKWLAEQLAHDAARDGLPVVIVNPSAAIGPGDARPTPTGRAIIDFVRHKTPFYLDTGLCLIDVDDVGEGHVLAAERGKIGERYILGHRNVTLYEFLSMIAACIGAPPPRIRLPRAVALAAAYCNEAYARFISHREPMAPLEGIRVARNKMFYDSSKAVRELGLPQSSVEAAIERAIRWFRDHGYFSPNFRGNGA